MANALLSRWSDRGAYNLGIYNCRRVAGSTSYSVHAEGRAFDLGIPAGERPRLGDEALTALLALDTPVLQRVIWWGRIYDQATPDGRAYSGVDPHQSHLHIEQPWSTADGLSQAMYAELAGEDDVSPEELKAAVRSVLNEGTGNGQVAWAGTSKATLATVQGLHNEVVALTALVRAMTP